MATQNIEIGEVWGSNGLLKVTEKSTIWQNACSFYKPSVITRPILLHFWDIANSKTLGRKLPTTTYPTCML